MTREEVIQAIKDRRAEDNIVTLLRDAGLPRRWTTPFTIDGRELKPEREIVYYGSCPERGLTHKLRAEYPRWVTRKREYALDQNGRRKKDAHGHFTVKREQLTAEAWMGRIRCESCGVMYHVNAELVAAFADDLAEYDRKHYARTEFGDMSSLGPVGHWGEHNERLDEAEERTRALAENPPPKRRMA